MKYILGILIILFIFSCKSKPIILNNYLGKVISIKRMPANWTNVEKTIIDLDTGYNFMLDNTPTILMGDSVYLVKNNKYFYFKRTGHLEWLY